MATKLYIEQNWFSWGRRMSVYNEDGVEVFYAQGEVFTIGRKMTLYDMHDRPIARITQKLLTFMPKYEIEYEGREYALVREMTVLRARLRIEGKPWMMHGSWLDDEFEIMEGDRLIMSKRRHWFTIGASFELDIADSADVLLCLCLSLAKDGMMADKK